MATCLIALGSNLGDRPHQLNAAIRQIALRIGLVARRSAWRETPPIGGPAEQPPYLNGAVLVHSSLPPRGVLKQLMAIEGELGRQRGERWGARAIDLDLLLCDQMVIDESDFQLPHPRMAFRRFVLEPAAEVAAAMIHPTSRWTVGRLRAHLDRSPRYLTLAGMPGVGKTEIAHRVAAATGAVVLADPLPLIEADVSPRPPLEREIELAERRAVALDRDRLHSGKSWFVSDFWWMQTAIYSNLLLGLNELDLAIRHMVPLMRRIARPRLTAVLDAPIDDLWKRARATNPALRAANEKEFQRLAEIYAEFAARITGPVLRLDARRQDAAITELVAAMAAAT
ncbi:MAG: 2-amino-4-hydroxy-6-hydroxymethyldihydropteridine diphosphokinase [Pirellulales bacterium]|nr:2-amino-4-hydroxy-6-hydroxymethyldihydropteridine diphosphokinase [Pirellulales bacterium]